MLHDEGGGEMEDEQHELCNKSDPLAFLAAAAAEAASGPDTSMTRVSYYSQDAGGLAVGSGPTIDEVSAHPCWGAQLRGDGSRCSPGFTGGTAHFKNKFCLACKAGTFHIPAAQVRALPADWLHGSERQELKALLSNGKNVGFWKTLPDGEYRIRLVNNTLGCTGPQLVVFQRGAPPPLDWGEMPDRWNHNGIVTLHVGKGTLVPRAHMLDVPDSMSLMPGGGASALMGCLEGATLGGCGGGGNGCGGVGPPMAGAWGRDGLPMGPTAKRARLAEAQWHLPPTPPPTPHAPGGPMMAAPPVVGMQVLSTAPNAGAGMGPPPLGGPYGHHLPSPYGPPPPGMAPNMAPSQAAPFGNGAVTGAPGMAPNMAPSQAAPFGNGAVPGGGPCCSPGHGAPASAPPHPPPSHHPGISSQISSQYSGIAPPPVRYLPPHPNPPHPNGPNGSQGGGMHVLVTAPAGSGGKGGSPYGSKGGMGGGAAAGGYAPHAPPMAMQTPKASAMADQLCSVYSHLISHLEIMVSRAPLGSAEQKELEDQLTRARQSLTNLAHMYYPSSYPSSYPSNYQSSYGGYVQRAPAPAPAPAPPVAGAVAGASVGPMYPYRAPMPGAHPGQAAPPAPYSMAGPYPSTKGSTGNPFGPMAPAMAPGTAPFGPGTGAPGTAPYGPPGTGAPGTAPQPMPSSYASYGVQPPAGVAPPPGTAPGTAPGTTLGPAAAGMSWGGAPPPNALLGPAVVPPPPIVPAAAGPSVVPGTVAPSSVGAVPGAPPSQLWRPFQPPPYQNGAPPPGDARDGAPATDDAALKCELSPADDAIKSEPLTMDCT